MEIIFGSEEVKKRLFHTIKSGNNFDGTYYELYLDNCVSLNAEEEVIRLLASDDGDVIAHVMNKSDESRFLKYEELDNNRLKNIYLEVYKDNVYAISLDDFFERLKIMLMDGDKMCVTQSKGSDGKVDYGHLVYTIYNSCDEIICEYSSRNEIYETF